LPAVKLPIVVTSLCAVLAIAGCGGGSDSSTGSTESSPAESSGSTAAESSSAGAKKKTKPIVTSPETTPPKRLEVSEWERGSGAVAKAGDEVTVQYVGTGFKTDKEFDSSWSRNEPFSFTLGAGEVIPGWEQGIEGMRVGARRQLLVPPDLAYGKAGSPPAIGPNEALIFVIDLLEVN